MICQDAGGTGCTRSVNDTPPKADTRRLDTFVHATQEVSTLPPGGPRPYRDRVQHLPRAGGARERTAATKASLWPASAARVPRGASGKLITLRREERPHTRFCALETRCPARRSESPRQMSPVSRFRVVRSDTSGVTEAFDGSDPSVCVHGRVGTQRSVHASVVTHARGWTTTVCARAASAHLRRKSVESLQDEEDERRTACSGTGRYTLLQVVLLRDEACP